MLLLTKIVPQVLWLVRFWSDFTVPVVYNEKERIILERMRLLFDLFSCSPLRIIWKASKTFGARKIVLSVKKSLR